MIKYHIANFHNNSQQLTTNASVKAVSKNFDRARATEVFSKGLFTFFPAYRFENPGYLNDPYKVNLEFNKTNAFSGYLKNPIEVVTGLPQLANWIMDLVLDLRTESIEADRLILSNLNIVISKTLLSKGYGDLRFGVGPRNHGGARIQVLENRNEGRTIYPSLFNLSSGESAILCLFGEILRQGDKISNNIALQNISGIVIIDEADKHLHIKLQKEVLPELLKLFPNIQFIISSHSPFLSMGLSEHAKRRSAIIDLDNNGIKCEPSSNELYNEVYKMMITENDRFKESFDALEARVKEGSGILIVTEGKTDTQHIRKAKEALSIDIPQLDFYEITENWGDSRLKLLLEQLAKVPNNLKIIGVFDRDVESIVSMVEADNNEFKDYGNNVYALCIPVPPGREDYENISIEFYYSDDEIKKSKNGRSLYFTNEVELLHNKTINKPEIRRLSDIRENEEHSKKILDEAKMCEVTDWIHSKATFADLIENDIGFSHDIDFSAFKLIFDRLKLILE